MVFLALIWIKITIYGLVVGRIVFGNLEPILRLWAGVFIITTISQYINFFVPINSDVQLILDLIIFSIAITQIKKLKQDLQEIFDFIENSKLRLTLVLILFIISLFSTSACSTVTDVGFYYLQSIKWIQEYPTVPGLGNLFTRLANNSNWFITCAVFNPYWLHPAYGLNGFLFFTTVIFLLKLFHSPVYDFSEKHRIVFLSLAAVPMLSLYQWHIESQNTDVVVTLLLWLIAGGFIAGEKDILNKSDLQILTGFLSLFLPTIKLNYLPVLIIPLYYLILNFRKRDYKNALLIAAMAFFIYAPWFARSVIVSGYLIFPVYQIDIFNFDWKMPKDILINENLLIKWWARAPNIDTVVSSKMNFSEWFPIWILNQSLINKILLVATITGVILYLKDLIFKKLSEDRALIILFFISLSGIGICLLTAPDLRFCYGFILLAIVIAYNEHLTKILNHQSAQLFLMIGLMIGLIANGGYIARTMDTGLLFPCHDYPESKRVKEINGIKIFMAQARNEMEMLNDRNKNRWIKWWKETHRGMYEDRLWDADLPASPYLRKGLKLRGKSIADGFKIENQ